MRQCESKSRGKQLKTNSRKFVVPYKIVLKYYTTDVYVWWVPVLKLRIEEQPAVVEVS